MDAIARFVGDVGWGYALVMFGALAVGLLVVGLTLVRPVVRGLVRVARGGSAADGAGGERWCGGCGFDLSGHPACALAFLVCPECGRRSARSGKRPLLWRRRPRLAVVGVLLLATGMYLWHERWEKVVHGWHGMIPSVALVMMVEPTHALDPYPMGGSRGPLARELHRRLEIMGGLEADVFVWRLARSKLGEKVSGDTELRAHRFDHLAEVSVCRAPTRLTGACYPMPVHFEPIEWQPRERWMRDRRPSEFKSLLWYGAGFSYTRRYRLNFIGSYSEVLAMRDRLLVVASSEKQRAVEEILRWVEKAHTSRTHDDLELPVAGGRLVAVHELTLPPADESERYPWQTDHDFRTFHLENEAQQKFQMFGSSPIMAIEGPDGFHRQIVFAHDAR